MPQQPIDYTMRYQIRSGRVNFADYVQRRQLVQDGALLGLNLYPPDNDASIVPIVQEGAANTTPAEYAEYLAQVAQEEATVPAAPTNLVAENGDQQATISFTAGSDGGSPIINYEYINLDASGAAWEAFAPPVTASPVTITGLPNGGPWRIQIRAVNAIGSGVASAIVYVSPAGPPSIPINLVATPGNGEITIEFIQTTDGGSPITNYLYSINNGTSFAEFSPAQTTTSVTITGLANGTEYSIQLKAKTDVGVSAASATVTGTPGGVPAEPTGLSGVGGNQTIYVLFTAGNNGGSAITNYEYSIDGAPFTAFGPAQTTSPVEISGIGLSNGTPYSVQLKAVNAIGAGIASSTVIVTPTTNTLNTSGLLVELDASNASSYSGSGTTWTNLQSSGSYSATLQNAPTFDGTNKYFTFDGNNQIAQIAAAAAINPTIGSSFTVQIWARVDTSSPNFAFGDGLISKQYGSPSYDGYSLSLRPDTSLYLKMNGSGVDGTYSSSTGVYDNGWALYTIVVRFGGGAGAPSYTYVSTRRVVTGTNADFGIPSNNAPIQFPRGIQESTANFCPADVGAFYLYNTAVSQEDIIRNYDATKTRYGL